MNAAQQAAEINYGRRFDDDTQVQQRRNTPMPEGAQPEQVIGEGIWKALLIAVLLMTAVVYANAMRSELITTVTSYRFLLIAGIGAVLIALGVLLWFLNRAFRGWDWDKW